MKPFINIPFLRITLPLLAGIVPAIVTGPSGFSVWWLLLPLALALSLLLLPVQDARRRVAMLLAADAFFVLLGFQLTHHSRLDCRENFYGNVASPDSACWFTAVISDLPEEKPKFMKCRLQLQALRKGKDYVPVTGELIAYFRKNDRPQELAAGQALLVRARLLDVQPPKNPGEFDYKAYLHNRQVYHTAFVDSGCYVPLQEGAKLNSVLLLGLRAKAWLLQSMRQSGLHTRAYSICSALLTGYDAEVEQPVIEAFSHSGTLHVLSVSGLHTGLIYLALNFLFNFVDRHRRYRLARFVFISLSLWLFALVTGFSAPVLRAVIMFSLFGLGKIYFRNSPRNQMNILMASAFALLLYNPFYVVDVGFLLSYTALGGIIYFQPRLNALWEPKHYLALQCWQSVTASTAATLGTLPITLFYFKQFPLWFFVCNLVVVPLTFVLLLMALLLAFKLGFVAVIINYLVDFLLYFIGLFNAEGAGYIDWIHFEGGDLAFMVLLLFMLSMAFELRSRRWVLASALLVVLWQLFALYASFNAKSGSQLTVYNIKNKSAYSIKNKTSVYLSRLDSSAFNYSIKPQLVSFNNPGLQVADYNFSRAGDRGLLVLGKPGYWPQVSPGEVTVLLLANNYALTERELEPLTALKVLVADASNNTPALKKAEELSRKFDLAFYSTRSKGAFIMPLP